MSPKKETGAVPLERLSQLESGQHYIREQTDRDRRTEGEKLRDIELKLEKLAESTTAKLGKHGEALAAISASTSTLKWMIATIIPAAVGLAFAAGKFFH